MLAALRFPHFFDFPPLAEDFDTLERQMSRRAAGCAANRTAGAPSRAFPALNVMEAEDKILIDAELPGVNPEALAISVHANTVTIQGERHPESSGEGDMGYHLRERGIGKFSKSFTFPVALNPEGVEARYENGLLRIVLPMAESAKARKIPVLNG